jgi:hypothetical protein
MINYEGNKFHFFLSFYLLVIRYGLWTLYFPAVWWFGYHEYNGIHRSWSFLRLTLEQRLYIRKVNK